MLFTHTRELVLILDLPGFRHFRYVVLEEKSADKVSLDNHQYGAGHW